VASILDVPKKRVTVQLLPGTSSTLATVRATVAWHSASKAAEAEAVLAGMRKLHVPGGAVDVQNVAFGSREAPLVCGRHEEALKAETVKLFHRYLNLKSEELDHLQAIASSAAKPSTGCSSCTPVQLFASQLGLSR